MTIIAIYAERRRRDQMNASSYMIHGKTSMETLRRLGLSKNSLHKNTTYFSPLFN